MSIIISCSLILYGNPHNEQLTLYSTTQIKQWTKGPNVVRVHQGSKFSYLLGSKLCFYLQNKLIIGQVIPTYYQPMVQVTT